MIEFEIGDKQYRAEKLNAFQQFHVSRKILPLLPALVPVFLQVQKMPGGFQQNLPAIVGALQPIADGLAALPDAAAEYVMSTCLAVVRRKQGDTWAPVWSAAANALMFDDMDLAAVMPIVVRIITDNLAPFIKGLPIGQLETSTAPASV